MDERKELLADVRAFLEWQRDCGTEVWKVEDFSCWKVRPTSRPQTSESSAQMYALPSPTPNAKQNLSQRPAEEPKPVSIEKPTTPLQGKWGKVLDQVPQRFDLTSLSDDVEGLKKIKLHQNQHCNKTPSCSIGAGRAKNPVLILEGHPKGLTQDAKVMLGKMVDKVLKIERSQMFWLPYPMGSICGSCSNLFVPTLECISPKVVLLMGAQLEGKVTLSPYRKDEVRFGNRVRLNLNKGSIPGVWTHHPTDLMNNPNYKQERFSHLRLFVDIIRRYGDL